MSGFCIFEKSFEKKDFILYHIDNSVTDLSEMFYNCKSLVKVYMPSFYGNNITKMKNMFDSCLNLEKIIFLRSLNTKSLKNMSNLFCDCFSLKKIINLSSFNTENVKKIQQ